jgi:hypothetical protein
MALVDGAAPAPPRTCSRGASIPPEAILIQHGARARLGTGDGGDHAATKEAGSAMKGRKATSLRPGRDVTPARGDFLGLVIPPA